MSNFINVSVPERAVATSRCSSIGNIWLVVGEKSMYFSPSRGVL